MTSTPPTISERHGKQSYNIITPSPDTLRAVDALNTGKMHSPMTTEGRLKPQMDGNTGCVSSVEQGIFRHAIQYPGGFARVQRTQRYTLCYELDMNNDDDLMILQLAIQIWLNTNQTGHYMRLMQSMMLFHTAYFNEDQNRFIAVDLYSPRALQCGVQWLTFLDWQVNRRQAAFIIDVDTNVNTDVHDLNAFGLFITATLPSLSTHMSVYKVQDVRMLGQVHWDGSGNAVLLSEPDHHRRTQDLIAGVRLAERVLTQLSRGYTRRFIYAQFGFDDHADTVQYEYGNSMMMTPSIYRAVLDLAVHLSNRYTNTYVELQGLRLPSQGGHTTQAALWDHMYPDIIIDNPHLIRNGTCLEERAPATNFLVQVFQIRYSETNHTIILSSSRTQRQQFGVTDVGQFM